MGLIRSTFGTMLQPVRAGASLLVNGPPDGWVADQPFPFWWIGQALETGSGPIGPNGPHATGQSAAVITRATSLIADPLVSDPFATDYLPDRWLTDPQLCRPDGRGYGNSAMLSRVPRSSFWRRWITDAMHWGQGVCLVPWGSGIPAAGLLRLNPLMVSGDDDGWWIDYGDDRVRIDDADGVVDLGQPFRVLRLLNPHWPDPRNPRGVFAAHPDTFGTLANVESYTRSAFRSGIPSGYLKATAPGMTQDQADDLKSRWMNAHGTSTRSIAVLNASTEFHPLTWSPVDAGLSEARRLSVADVAYAFGMSPEVLGTTMGNSATYSNISDWWRLHRDFALSPWVDAIEGSASALLPGDHMVRVNLDGSNRPPIRERLDAYKVGIDAGIFTADQVREWEGWGDAETDL